MSSGKISEKQTTQGNKILTLYNININNYLHQKFKQCTLIFQY